MKIYDAKDLENAVDEVKNGKLTLRAAAEKYNIDKMKIYRKCKNICQKPHGGQQTLGEVEESILKGSFKTLNCSLVGSPTVFSYGDYRLHSNFFINLKMCVIYCTV